VSKVCPQTSLFTIFRQIANFLMLNLSLCCVCIYLGLEIRGNLGLKSNLLNLKSVEGFPREGSTPSLGIFSLRTRTRKRVRGKRIFPRVVRFGGRILGRGKLPLLKSEATRDGFPSQKPAGQATPSLGTYSPNGFSGFIHFSVSSVFPKV